MLVKILHNLVNRIAKRASDDQSRKKQTCKEYMEEIKPLPEPLAGRVFQLNKCIERLEKIPGILHPLEGYALFEIAKGGALQAPIAEVGSYLGKSTSYMALGSMIAENQGVIAIDMFPAKKDWYKGDDGLWHIHGSDYYLEEAVYKEREHFFYGGSHYTNTLDIFNDVIGRLNLKKYITAYRGNSTSYMESRGGNAQFRMIFIDGDHTYQGVKRDIEALSGAVVDGGYLCFHDYCDSFPGVIRAVDELIFANPQYQKRCVVYGLAIVQKKISR